MFGSPLLVRTKSTITEQLFQLKQGPTKFELGLQGRAAASAAAAAAARKAASAAAAAASAAGSGAEPARWLCYHNACSV